MTIDEAIKNLIKYHDDHHSFPTDIYGQAMALGIEALKYHKYRRGTADAVGSPLLSGETKE
jgi:hypothetical protein